MANPPFPSFDFDTSAIRGKFDGRIKWVTLALLLIPIIFLLWLARGIFTDYLWFSTLGFEDIFITVLMTKIILFAIGFFFVFVFVLGNLFYINKKTSGPIEAPIPDNLLGILAKLVLLGCLLISLVLAVILGSVLASKWELFLRFSNAAVFGVNDPLYSNDISFYVFELPIYSFLQGWFLASTAATIVATGALAFLNFTLRGTAFTLTTHLRNHLIILGSIAVLLISFGYWIDRWELVRSEQGIVYGAAYADVFARQPAYLILCALGVLVSLIMLVGTFLGKIKLSLAPVGLWVILIIALGTVWPSVVQQFSVDPDEFVKEKKYIERNIEFTKLGFGLEAIDETFYQAEGEITADLIQENIPTVENIRLWDYKPLTNVYKQIQLIRPYYDFKDADVDRYDIDGEYRQVLLAAREVAPEKLKEEAQTWVNEKLFYTHGIGIAMSPATEFTPEGRPIFFAKDIPANGEIPVSSPNQKEFPDIIVKNPRIYYGENTKDYVIVDTNTGELDYQTGEGELIVTNYEGSGGVSIGSYFRKLIYAWQMRDINILISNQLNEDSKIQYRRSIEERVTAVAPFLKLDKDPYIVAANGQLYWIQDAYTTSDKFPYSQPTDEESSLEHYNYIRNSIKIVVDAYTGELDFYLWDRTDPVALTYEKMFPTLFSNIESMPEDLASHVRYPQGLFAVQAEKYIKYHMEDPQHFYGNEDLWAFPQEKFGQQEGLQPLEPYYVIMRLPGETQEEFVQLIPYTPDGRPNMVGWLAARSDASEYGKLVAFNFPKDRQVDGPEQVEARIDNDQDISAWFTLRCTEGSTCIRGNLLVIPIGNSILYAEPIYIQAEGVSFPELKKVILSTADKVVMGDSLNDALYMLTGAKESIPAVGLDKGEKDLSSTSQVEAGEDSQLNQIKDSIKNLKAELDTIESLFQNLEEVIKGE
ncbi:UPF0182 family protein [Chloroflexi bacterium]|nr:UPF0182 family protein [Chloroflexota bacterium]